MYPNQYCKPCNQPEPCIEVPAPPDCIGEPCDEIVLDTCVRYTGPTIECLGIETGANLNDVIQIIAARLCDCCDGTPPVVDCEVSEWGPWSECVDGVQTRERTIIQSPINGGAECPPLVETRECCSEPIDCVVSAWSEWSECLDGVQTRTRTIVSPAECGGAPCPELEETRACCLPINCVVSEWGAWSECVDGFRTRTRTVVTPASCGGTPCAVLTETSPCDMPCVPLTDITVLSDNCETLQISATDDGNATVLYAELFNNNAPTVVVATKIWTPLGSATVYSHTFTGLTPGNYFVKIYKDAGTVKCDTVVTSAVLVQGCPVDCVVSDWSAWSECIEGEQTRTRTIVTPASNGGTPCPVLIETQPCDMPCVPVTDFTAISNSCETLSVSLVDNGDATDLHVTLYNPSNPTLPLFTHDWIPTGNPGSYTHTFTGLSGGTYIAIIYKLSDRSACDPISSANVVVETCKSACPAPTGLSATVTA